MHTRESTFNPPSDGLYMVYTDARHHHSPYNKQLHSSENNGRFVVRANSGLGSIGNWVEVWSDSLGGWVPHFSFDKFMAFDHPGDKIWAWDGPQKYHRECFKCNKPIFPEYVGGDEEEPNENVKHVLQCSDAADLRTGGHYGSTFIDSFDSTQISVLICDDCLRQNGSKVLWFKTRDRESYDFRTEEEEQRRNEVYREGEIRIMEAAGFEWRNYNNLFELTINPKEFDINDSGWYHKSWQPCGEITVYNDGSRGCSKDSGYKHEWRRLYPEVEQALENLRLQVFHPDESAEAVEEERHRLMMSNMGCETPEQLKKHLAELSEAMEKSAASYDAEDHIDHEATKNANEERKKRAT